MERQVTFYGLRGLSFPLIDIYSCTQPAIFPSDIRSYSPICISLVIDDHSK